MKWRKNGNTKYYKAQGCSFKNHNVYYVEQAEVWRQGQNHGELGGYYSNLDEPVLVWPEEVAVGCGDGEFWMYTLQVKINKIYQKVGCGMLDKKKY